MVKNMRYAAAAGIAGLMTLGMGVGALAQGIVISSPSSSAYVQQCIDKWEDAPAYSYCSSASVSRVGASTEGASGNCIVRGTCSVTATVGGDEESEGSLGVGQTTWAPEVNLTLKKRNTDSIDICFSTSELVNARDTVENGWNASVKMSCGSTETTVANAVANGLSEVISNSSGPSLWQQISTDIE